VTRIRRRQLIGFAGIAAHRLARALGLPPTEAGALRLLALHPVFNPGAYVHAEVDEEAIVVRRSPAHDDGAWISLCGPHWVSALQAVVRVLDPRLDVELEPLADAAWRLTAVRREAPTTEAPEVTVAKFSTGTDFAFEHRRSLPITPV
jgi:hypothetical protein